VAWNPAAAIRRTIGRAPAQSSEIVGGRTIDRATARMAPRLLLCAVGSAKRPVEEVPPAASAALCTSLFFWSNRVPSLLLVDDDRNFREALAIALRLDGLQVAVCAEEDEAIRWLGRMRFDACLADTRLPALDALAVAAARSGVRLLLTGTHADLVAAAARRHPPASSVPKPVRPADLAPWLSPAPATAAAPRS
jgi:CheY-like chemotaxis protein